MRTEQENRNYTSSFKIKILYLFVSRWTDYWQPIIEHFTESVEKIEEKIARFFVKAISYENE